MKSNFSLILTLILATSVYHSKAAQSDCRKKYTGNIALGTNQVGTGGQQNTLGQVGKGDYKAVSFAFWECKINNYYRSPDEFGFLVADGVNPSNCATAVLGDVNGATVNHQACDFDGKDKDKINRQLVYANYYRPNGGDANVDIFFQGSPLIPTRTGFDSKHALLWQGQEKGGLEVGQLVVNNQTSQLNYDRLTLHDVSIAATDSLVSHQQTTSEGKIVKDVKGGLPVTFAAMPAMPGTTNNFAATGASGTPSIDKSKLFSN
ncbi:uncharacterized protein FA14DRAFT_158744 [Meira miltonrushii]|uniref:Uncharacterized protein n=1 Tax=Meira miltonrushii TaxID=1280837 RepID=A0A316V278_9BASI|nr:uncharacterized protein FA14DRAFT_158744 [Meira miltonrushii]PWN31374.1 hypothetical protein FA14DRAFT_158744 [Meira miltonrushii]